MKSSLKIILPILIFILVVFSGFKFYEFHLVESRSKEKIRKEWITLKEGSADFFKDYLEFNRALPGAVTEFRILKDEKLVHKSEYTYTHQSLRQTPHINKKASSHLIAAGCSITFGEALDIKETFLYQLMNKNPDLNPYNLGVIGGGLHTAHRLLDLIDFRLVVKEEKGTFLYILIEDHLARWFARPRYIFWANEMNPHYQVHNQKVEYKGPISNHPEYKLYQRMKDMGLAHTYLKVRGEESADSKWTEIELNQFQTAIASLRDKYLRKFPKGNFGVVIFPMYEFNSEVIGSIKEFSHKENILFLDPRADFTIFKTEKRLSESDLRVPYDGHPSSIVNVFMSEWLGSHLPLP